MFREPRSVCKRLMRHHDIQTTLNIYGDVVPDEMERAASEVDTLALNPDSTCHFSEGKPLKEWLLR
jgi:hypothetical protein